MVEDKDFHPFLLWMINEGKTIDLDGNEKSITGPINKEEARFMHWLIINRNCRQCLETGVAYGVSTVTICDALSKLNGERIHWGVDPCQLSEFNGAALAALNNCNLSTYFKHLDGPSHKMLPALLGKDVKLDFAFIDGWHTFDYTLIDVFYIDKMLRIGGVMLIHDAQWPSKRKVWGYLKHHRKYKKVINPFDEPRYQLFFNILRNIFLMLSGAANENFRLAYRNFRLLMGRKNLLALEKVGEWEPNYDFFKNF